MSVTIAMSSPANAGAGQTIAVHTAGNPSVKPPAVYKAATVAQVVVQPQIKLGVTKVVPIASVPPQKGTTSIKNVFFLSLYVLIYDL